MTLLNKSVLKHYTMDIYQADRCPMYVNNGHTQKKAARCNSNMGVGGGQQSFELHDTGSWN